MNAPSVCIVCEMPPPAGGMSVQAERLGRHLRDEGHAVRHVRTNALAHGSPLRRVKGLRGLVNFAGYLAQLARGIPPSRIVHVFSHSYLSFWLFTLPAVAMGRALGKRVVVHYHGGSADEFLAGARRAVSAVLRRADALLVPSGFLVEVFARHGHAASELPNVMPLDRFAFRAREPLAPRILMARHLRSLYNPACGLRAFALFAAQRPEARLSIAGDGPERAALQALAGALGVRERVDFLGHLDQDRMREAFESHDVLLNSSRVDNQPVSLLEAFACGLPVVSTAVGGIPHMLRDGVDGLLAPDDSAATLAAQLARLFDEPGLATALARSARERVAAHDWTRVYPRLAAAYRGKAT
jgi:glycosyltransferase involved in cell wall biosynthesis